MLRPNFTRWLSRLFSSAAVSRRKAFHPRVEGLEDRLAPATFTVLNTSNAGVGSLRQAITDANSTAGADVIEFNIPGAGVRVINLNSALPTITETVDIDGTTQPTYVDVPLIALNGANAGGGANGLVISGGASNGSVVSALIIRNFKSHGISILSNGNTVESCFIGLNNAATAAAPNGGSGVALLGAASGNTIGGLTTNSGNIISGNKQNGIVLQGSGVTGNQIQGNAIGTDIFLTVAVPNQIDGIALSQGANNNTVGDLAGVNLIQTNRRFGVSIAGIGTSGNTVFNNTIAFNTSSGVQISGGAAGNTIGNGNVISANRAHGVHFTGAGTSNNTVSGNVIGLDSGGTLAFGNTLDGVFVNGGATNNIIGGVTPADRNVISANLRFGVNIAGSGSNFNQVQGNYIGTNLGGSAAIGNRSSGVRIGAGASFNNIGGTGLGAGNTISGNVVHGVWLTGAGVTGNSLSGNFIGISAAGTAAVANGSNGILVNQKASNNSIGLFGGAGNVVSGNALNGISIANAGTTGNQVIGNIVGLDSTGSTSIANLRSGVQITGGASGNSIGGAVAGLGNTISSNSRFGVLLNGVNQTIVRNNKIGTKSDGTGVFGNTSHGVLVTNTSANNFIGGTTTDAGNTIANNGGAGVVIGSDPAGGFSTAAGFGNAINQNSIFANALLGIDLGANNGVTPNDVKDPDGGPNRRQNFPILTSAIINGANLDVTFSLNSIPNSSFRIELFSTGALDGTGEGKKFLGFVIVTTDPNGDANLTTSVPYSLIPDGVSITATATNLATNDTSEFSAPIDSV